MAIWLSIQVLDTYNVRADLEVMRRYCLENGILRTLVRDKHEDFTFLTFVKENIRNSMSKKITMNNEHNSYIFITDLISTKYLGKTQKVVTMYSLF